MRMCEHNQTRRTGLDSHGLWIVLPILIIAFASPTNSVFAQSIIQENLSQQIQKLMDAMGPHPGSIGRVTAPVERNAEAVE
jgi:hypothetical protein